MMQGRLSATAFLAALLLLAACTQSAGQPSATRPPSTTEVATALKVAPTAPPTTAPATPTPTADESPAATATTTVTRTPVGSDDETGIPAVDVTIAVILGNDLERRRALVRFVTSGCTTAEGLGGPPKCTEGQEEGALVDYLPLGGPGEGSYVLAAEAGSVLAFEVESLYAAYRVADDLHGEPEYPHGRYVLFFTTAGGEAGSETRIVRVDDAGAIVRLDSIGAMPADFYFQQMAADLLDPPPEPRMFSSEAAEILIYPPEMRAGGNN